MPFRFASAIRTTRTIVLGVWSLDVTVLGASLVVGAIGLNRLCRGAEPAGTPLQERSRRLARLSRLRRVPSVLVHARLAEPFLCGVLRPKILLPKRWAGCSSPRALDAVLAHELAHARRQDQVVNLAQRLVEVGLFFHPAVHWLSRSLRRERELCADALAVRLTGDPLALAEALQSVARLRLESPRIPAVGASLGGPSVSLLPRIQELIGMTPSRPRFSVWPLAALPAAGFLALIASAAGIADERPSTGGERPHVANRSGAPSAGNASRPTTRQIDPITAPFDVLGDPRFYGENGPINVEDDRQICFQVRFIVSNSGAWRKPLGDRLELLKREGEVAAWTLDDRALTALLDGAQTDKRTNVLQAPKVTSFNGARATILNRSKQFYVADVERVDGPHPGFRPIVKSLDLGSRVDMTGTVQPRGTRLSARVSDSWLVAMPTRSREERIGSQIQRVEYHDPSVIERACDVTADIPEGTHLLVSLGRSTTSPKVTGLPGLVNNVFAAIGLPEPIELVPFERLVLITPRPIIVEQEEQPVRSASQASSESRVH